MDTLNSLLRGEIAAAETYKQALDGLGQSHRSDGHVLRSIMLDHGAAIRFLHDQIAAQGGSPTTGSGLWGVFARTWESAAKAMGDSTALSALREGERHGLSDYERALDTAVLPAKCRVHIEDTLIPRQRQHIEELDRLIDRN